MEMGKCGGGAGFKGKTMSRFCHLDFEVPMGHPDRGVSLAVGNEGTGIQRADHI